MDLRMFHGAFDKNINWPGKKGNSIGNEADGIEHKLE